MDTYLRHKLLAYLSGAAIAMSSGAKEETGSELVSIPEPIMAELLVDLNSEVWKSQDLIRLTELLADDPRRKVRRRAADMFARGQHNFSSDELRLLLTKFARDPDPMVRHIVTPVVVEWLCGMNAFDRDCTVLDWATSDNATVRQTVVEALQHEVRTLGTDLVIEHLAGDENPVVRAAVVQAATRRARENPQLYIGVLNRLSNDKRRAIKKSARQSLARLIKRA